MSGRSSWCFTGDHPGCRYAACSCACHAQPPEALQDAVPAPEPGSSPAVVGPVLPVPPVLPVLPAVPARPVPAGEQAEIGFPDGLDGSTDDVETVSVSLRGQGYEVDLSAVHRRELQAALAPFLAVARLVAPPSEPGRPSAGP